MKGKTFIWLCLIWAVTVQCDSEDAIDCLQTEGQIISQEFQVGAFNSIRIEDGVRLVVKQGDTQEVLITTGENLLPDVEVILEESTLVIKNNNNCNLFRDYGITTATVTVVNLEEIRNSSRFEVRSQGSLDFPRLRLLSNTTGDGSSGKKSGDFYLSLNTNNLRISANGVSVFYLNGFARNADIIFSDEQPRLEGEALLIDNIDVLQTSANKMIINPQLSLTGEIRGTGDVISKNRPDIVDVSTLFTGRLIFED